MTARKFPQKHIDRLETMLREMRRQEARFLDRVGPCKTPGCIRASDIKRAESLEQALIWIKEAA